MNITEGFLTLAIATAIGWPTVSYIHKNHGDLAKLDSKGLTEMVLENQCSKVDERYIDVSELTGKKGAKKAKQKKSATNLCGLDNL